MLNQNELENHRLETKLENAKGLADAGLNAFYGLNAALTVVYCAFVVWYWLTPSITFQGISAFLIVTALFGGAALILLDGARVFWANAKIAQDTNRFQQVVANALEVANFAGSLVASVIGLRFLWGVFGTTELTALETSTETMTTLLSAALTVNMVAAFVYRMRSPESNQLRVISRAGARFMGDLTTGIELMLKDAQADVPLMLAPYASQIKQAKTAAAVNKVLQRVGFHAGIEALPPPSEIESEANLVGSFEDAEQEQGIMITSNRNHPEVEDLDFLAVDTHLNQVNGHK